MVQINWTIQAKDDLKSIAEYISRDSIRYAKLQVNRIKPRTNYLKISPLMGKVVVDFDKNDILEITEGRYRIIYWIISKNQIDILTIHHSSRDLSNRKI